MPDYYNYYGSVGRDPTRKYVIEGTSIVCYTKCSLFFSFAVPWKRGDSFPVLKDTEIAEEYVGSDGSGWLELRAAAGGSGKFYIYEHAAEFIAEVKRNVFEYGLGVRRS